MANTVIQLKKSATPSQVPGDLANGELAINYADGKLFYKDSSGSIQQISSGGNTFSTINAAGTFVTAGVPNDIVTFDQGDNIAITGDALNNKVTIAANLIPAFDYANSIAVSGGGVSVGSSPPGGAIQGSLWWDTYSGKMFIYYTDVDSSQWVESSPSGLGDYFFDLANTVAVAAFDKANSALQNTSGTFAGDLTVTGNVISQKQSVVYYTPATTDNAAIHVLAANTKGGTGYADVFKLTNLSGGATNPNKWIRINPTGNLEVVNSAYNMASAVLTDAGNLTTAGTITPGAWTAGQVIKDTILSNSEVTVVSTTIATSGSTTNFVTYNYTPVSASSYLIVHFHLSKYTPAGTTDDSWYSQLQVDNSEIAYGWQMVNNDGTGTSGRSGVLFPLMGRYTNSSTSAKQIQVAARRDSADDSITIDNSATSMWLRITEVAR